MSQRSSLKRSSLVVAFLTIFLDLLGFGIIIPIQPFYAETFGATPAVVTLLGASYSLMQFIFSPFWGRLSDRVGRRPIVLFSVFISAVGHFAFALATTLSMLFVARAVAGFGNANIGTAQAIVADVTSRENRSVGMGLFGAAFGLGFILGPAIGGLLGQIHPTTPIFAAGLLALLNLIMAALLLPETRNPSSQPSTRKVLPLALLKQAGQYTNVKALLLISLFYTTAFALMEQTIALFIGHTWVGKLSEDPVNGAGIESSTVLVEQSLSTLSESAKLTALFLIVIGFVAVIVQGGLIRKLSANFGEVKLIRFGLVIVIITMALIPAVGQLGSYPLLLVLGGVMAIGSGLLNPAKSSLLSQSIPDSEQGAILGLNQSFSSLGRVIGPVCAGMLYELMTGLPFYLSAALIALVAMSARGLVDQRAVVATSSQDAD